MKLLVIFFLLKQRPNNRMYIDTQGYRVILIDGHQFKAHRLAWLYIYGEFPKKQIDHVNHDRSDNKISNLRDVTNQENHKNRGLNKNNTSGVNGVAWNKQLNKWIAYIIVASKRKHLGVFVEMKEAVLARQKANKEYGFHFNHGK